MLACTTTVSRLINLLSTKLNFNLFKNYYWKIVICDAQLQDIITLRHYLTLRHYNTSEVPMSVHRLSPFPFVLSFALLTTMT